MSATACFIDTVLCVKLCIDTLGIVSATGSLLGDDLGGLVGDHLLHLLLLSLPALRAVVVVLLRDVDLAL